MTPPGWVPPQPAIVWALVENNGNLRTRRVVWYEFHIVEFSCFTEGFSSRARQPTVVSDLAVDKQTRTTRAEDAQGTPIQGHTSPSLLVCEDNTIVKQGDFYGINSRQSHSEGSLGASAAGDSIPVYKDKTSGMVILKAVVRCIRSQRLCRTSR